MSLTIAQERARASWQFRCIDTTRGNQTKIGCILLAALGKLPKHAPRFSIKQGAVILEDGMVVADFQYRDDLPFRASRICDVEEYVANFRGLADHLKLVDADRVALFLALQQWIAKDFRATSELDF